MPVLARGETINIPPGKIHSVRELPLSSDVPAEAQRTIEAAIRASVERENADRAAETAAFQDFGDRYRADLRKLMGADGYAEYRALVREEKAVSAKLLVPRGKLGLSAAERQRLRQQQKKRFNAFLRARGIGSTQLTQLQARAEKRFSKLTGPMSKRRIEGPTPLAPGRVPQHIRDSVGNPVTDPTPPYGDPAFWSASSWAGDEGDEFSITGFDWGYNKVTGAVGNCAQVGVTDASNSDTVIETRRTLFGFWTKVPANTKSLKIWVNANVLSGRVFQHLTTEWYGVSHGFFRHENWLFAEVLGVGDGLHHQGRTAHTVWTAGSQLWPKELTGTWEANITGGGWWLLEINSLPLPVPGGAFFVWVGTESIAKMWVDDEDGLGSSSFSWRLNSIQFDPST